MCVTGGSTREGSGGGAGQTTLQVAWEALGVFLRSCVGCESKHREADVSCGCCVLEGLVSLSACTARQGLTTSHIDVKAIICLPYIQKLHGNQRKG